MHDLSESMRVHPGMTYTGSSAMLGTYLTMFATVIDSVGRAVSMPRTYLQDGRKASEPTSKKLPLLALRSTWHPVHQACG